MYKRITFVFALILWFSSQSISQNLNQLRNRMGGSGQSGKGNKDSLVHRNPNEDSITISYRYFDSSRVRKLDSSINDWYTRFPVPPTYNYLSNFGSAAHSLLFNLNMEPGFDAGFHSFDIYKYTLAGTRFFQTTRPYTELSYALASDAEQMVNVLHTQNRKNNLNFTFEYRFIGSPGAFKNQNASHNNLRISSFYQSKNKRYGLYFIYLYNKIKVSENGGLVADSELQNSGLNGSINNPIAAGVRLYNPQRTYGSNGNVFNTYLDIGNAYTESTIYLRQYYDFGQKDSIVHDSTVTRLFYPRLRLQHSISYSSNTYEYHDDFANSTDSSYINFYHYYGANNVDTLLFQDKWRNLNNEFSIITFPDKKNVAQFLRLSANLELIKGTLYNVGSKNYTNVYASAEYRNRTRNQKWEVEAFGRLYLAGSFVGNYTGYISLQRQLSKKLGILQVGFQNTNKSPTELSQNITSFPVIPVGSIHNTNIAKLFANIFIPEADLRLYGSYYAVTNYTYLTNYFTLRQQSSLFNYLTVGLEKKVKLSRHLFWYTEAAFQQSAGNAPVHLPQIYTRNRFAFEGNFYKNLYLSTGIEVRYFTPYKADGYTPLNGQFYYQSDSTLSNRPDVNVYFNFRIKSFKAFIRLENLNTLDKYNGSFGFLNHNFSAPHYPQNALWIRFWRLVEFLLIRISARL